MRYIGLNYERVVNDSFHIGDRSSYEEVDDTSSVHFGDALFLALHQSTSYLPR